MKKVFFLILAIMTIQLGGFCAPKKMLPNPSDGKEQLPNIFIYTIDDDTFKVNDEEQQDNEYTDAVNNSDNDSEISVTEDYEPVLGATVLKGYAQYVEDSDAIYLKDDNNQFLLNIKTPQKISASKGLNLNSNAYKPVLHYQDAEYLIAPNYINTSTKIGNLTIGAKYNNEIDNIAMLETETGLFTKYEREKFALSSSVTKSLNTTYGQDYSTFVFAPELKINKHLSLKNVFSADVTRNRRAAKLVFSISPFKDTDRFLLELEAKQTYYLENDRTTTQFSFSSQWKL